MREDHLEAMENMYPKGYMIIYIQPNGDPAMAWYNPHYDEVLNACTELVDNVLNEGYDETAN